MIGPGVDNGSHRVKLKNKEILALIAVSGFALFSMIILQGSIFAAAQTAASISTDKDDYAPGEVVTITGSGFSPDSTIWLVIYNPQDETVIWNATSDSSGGFVTTFTLGGYQPYYRVIAQDEYGNNAQTTFTDSAFSLTSVNPSNSGGTTTTSFTAGDTVYATVTGTISGGSCSGTCAFELFVVSSVPANGNPLVDVRGTSTLITITLSSPGGSQVFSLGSSISPGTYYIVADRNNNGDKDGSDTASVSSFTVNGPTTADLTIIKHIVNGNGGTAELSDFSFFVNTTEVTNNTSTAFDPGFYNVTETGPSGYSATFGGDCDEFGGVTLAAGDDKTCTIENNDVPPKLTLIKYIINDDGGTETNFAPFIANASEPNETTLAVNATTTLPSAGTYNITENVDLTKYTATFGDDCTPDGQIEIGIGETLTCTITNDDIPPSLTIIKTIINDNGGEAELKDLTFFVNSTQVTNNTATEFDAGFYNVTETGAAGYNATFGGDCDEFGGITLETGSYTCEIINDDIPPRLLFIKYVINDNGGTVTDFGPFTANTTVLSNNTETELPLAGTYNVTEGNVAGYAATFGDDCAPDGLVTIEIGETLTCSITNDDIAPKLTIHKTIVNDNGGTADIGDFTFSVNGTQVTNGTATDFDAGFYNVTETGAAGYNATFGGDCDEFGGITMAIGNEYTCTITNDDIAPILIVIKHVINDDGGQAEADDFTMNVDGTDVSDSSFDGEESPGTEVTLDAGSYNVTESGPIIYMASFSDDCEGTIDIGEEKTCIVTNDDISPFKVTSSSLCEIPNNQFRDIFTIDPNNPAYYKDTATNPGQFYVNILVTGAEGDDVDIPVTLPYPFITQGANPIQVHDGVTVDSNECYIPSGSVPFTVSGLNEKTPNGSYKLVLGDYPSSPEVGTTVQTIHVTGEMPSSGLFYVTIHLDFGFKGTGPWRPDNGDALPVAPTNTLPPIPNGVTFEFNASNFDEQVLTKQNVFKKNPGFAGLVTTTNGDQPTQNVKVTFYDSKGKKLGEAITDEDGYYYYYYKYTGKASTVTIKLLNYGLQSDATMKANGFVLTSFKV